LPDPLGPMPQGVPWLPPALLLTALLLDIVFGGARLVQQVPGLGRLFARPALFLTRRLDRSTRTPRVLAVRGALITALLLLAATLLGVLLQRATHSWPGGLGIELLALSSGLAVSRPVGALRRALARSKTETSGHAPMRAAIEQTAGALESGLALPAVAYLLLGLGGFVIAVAARVIDRAVGGARPGERPFAAAAHAAHRLLAALPGHLLAVGLVMAALFVPRTKPFGAVREAWRATGRDRPTLAAFAGVLQVALGGPPRWSGKGTARVTRADLGRAFALYIACVVVIVLVLLALSLAEMPAPVVWIRDE
jgi:cobalamin biosynthesis protein CobD/CbiB